MDWYPQAPLTAFQACRRRFFLFSKQHALLKKVLVCEYLLSIVNNYGFYPFVKTPNRRGTQIHAERWSNFVLSSHLDPIGHQNDVQELSICYIHLAYLVLYLPSVLRTYLHISNTPYVYTGERRIFTNRRQTASCAAAFRILWRWDGSQQKLWRPSAGSSEVADGS